MRNPLLVSWTPPSSSACLPTASSGKAVLTDPPASRAGVSFAGFAADGSAFTLTTVGKLSILLYPSSPVEGLGAGSTAYATTRTIHAAELPELSLQASGHY